MTTFQTIAKELHDAFQTTARGEDEITTLIDGAPEWITSAIYECHRVLGERLPDAWIYEHARYIAGELAECEDHDQACDAWTEIACGLVDPYTHDLVKWLASHLLNLDCCDEAQGEQLVKPDATMYERIAAGQQYALESITIALAHAVEAERESRGDV